MTALEVGGVNKTVLVVEVQGWWVEDFKLNSQNCQKKKKKTLLNPSLINCVKKSKQELIHLPTNNTYIHRTL